MNESDFDLNAKVVAGDRRAFAVLVARHEARLRSFLARVAGRDDADDLAQEAFLRAWRSAHAYRGNGAYGGWLLSIGWRVFLDSARSARRNRSMIAAQTEMMLDAKVLPEGEAGIDTRRLLAALDPLERACLILCHGHGWSHSEAATILAMPLGSLKTRLGRATRRCEDALKRQPVEEVK